MCIAIYKPADIPANWDGYENGYINNPDSWGFAALYEGQLYCHWGIESFEEFFKAYEPFETCQSLIHFRIRTSGEVDIDNCHPFLVADDLAFIHNGMIDIQLNLNQKFSDTWHFNELVLKPMHDADPDFFRRADVIYTQQRAHKYNKFAFLRADGAFAIWNAGDGETTSDGHWYSNDGYRSSAWWKKPVSRTVSVTVDLAKNQRALTAADADDTVVETVDEEELRQAELWADERAARSESYYDEEYVYDEVAGDHQLTQMCEDLRAFGFTDETVREVRSILGYTGISALHDAL